MEVWFICFSVGLDTNQPMGTPPWQCSPGTASTWLWDTVFSGILWFTIAHFRLMIASLDRLVTLCGCRGIYCLGNHSVSPRWLSRSLVEASHNGPCNSEGILISKFTWSAPYVHSMAVLHFWKYSLREVWNSRNKLWSQTSCIWILAPMFTI